jgi:hypothetical protein
VSERQRHSRHGLNALKARVKVRGLQAIDQRTVAAQALLGWQRELIEDLGGEAAVSAQQRALVEVAVRTRLYVDALDAWMMEHGSLVNARRRALHPVVRERQQLVDSLARLLGLLGLERRQPKAVDLSAYLRARYGADEDRAGSSTPSRASHPAPDAASAREEGAAAIVAPTVTPWEPASPT